LRRPERSRFSASSFTDAIVVLDSIIRLIEAGMAPINAALLGNWREQRASLDARSCATRRMMATQAGVPMTGNSCKQARVEKS
jgi:hypothetical protein